MWIHVKHDEPSLTPGGEDLITNGEPPTRSSVIRGSIFEAAAKEGEAILETYCSFIVDRI